MKRSEFYVGGIYLSYFGVRFSSFPHWESTDETNFGFSSQSYAILRINFTCTKVGVNDNLAVNIRLKNLYGQHNILQLTLLHC